MKKSKIGIVIIAIVLITVGLGLFIGGVISVGGMTAAKDVLEKQGVYFDNGFQIDIHRGKSFDDNEKVKIFDRESKTFSTENVRKLDLEAGGAEIEFVQEDSAKEISVHTDGKYDIDVKKDVLYIKTKNEMENHKLVLKIPSDFQFDNIEIEAGASAVKIESLNTKLLDVEIGAGEIVINQLYVQKCELSVGMGNAQIRLAGNQEDYNYEIECGAGNVEIGDESFGGLASERSINNHANALIEIECGMGNVTIEF